MHINASLASFFAFPVFVLESACQISRRDPLSLFISLKWQIRDMMGWVSAGCSLYNSTTGTKAQKLLKTS